jgi:hypothetical protein
MAPFGPVHTVHLPCVEGVPQPVFSARMPNKGRRLNPPPKYKQPLLIFGRSGLQAWGLLIHGGCLFMELVFPLVFLLKENVFFLGVAYSWTVGQKWPRGCLYLGGGFNPVPMPSPMLFGCSPTVGQFFLVRIKMKAILLIFGFKGLVQKPRIHLFCLQKCKKKSYHPKLDI